MKSMAPGWRLCTRIAFEPERPLCAMLFPQGKGQREARHLTIVFPEHAGWGWVLPDARSLLATVTYLDQTLARPIIDSPDLVAHQLLTDLTLDQPTSWLRSSPIDLHNVHSTDGATLSMMESIRDFVWMRPLTLVEQRQRYLHKYKHISSYLEACTAVQLGAGAPEFSSTGRAYDGIRPGIWRVHAEQAGSIFDGKKLPYFLDGSGSARLRSIAALTSATVCTCGRVITGHNHMNCLNGGQRPCGRLLNACTRKATNMSMEEQMLLIPLNCLQSSVWLSWQKEKTMEDGLDPTGGCILLDAAVPFCLPTWHVSRERDLCQYWWTRMRSGSYLMIPIRSRQFPGSGLLTDGGDFLLVIKFHFPSQMKSKPSSGQPNLLIR